MNIDPKNKITMDDIKVEGTATVTWPEKEEKKEEIKDDSANEA